MPDAFDAPREALEVAPSAPRRFVLTPQRARELARHLVAGWGGASDALRDHPVFELPAPEARNAASRGADWDEAWALHEDENAAGFKPLAPALQDEEREAHFERETLRVFRVRGRLLMAASMAALPVFWAIYTHFAPQAALPIGLAHAAMFGACCLLFRAMQRVRRLRAARLLAALTYLVFSLTAAVAMIAAHDRRVNVLSGHSQIIMSLLFVPFGFAECALCSLLVVLSYTGGLLSGASESEAVVFWPRVASLLFTACIMPIMAHLMQMARRRAFDSAFDMAVSAARGAALSSLDPVTGGFNRRFCEDTLEREIERAARHELSLSLVLFDLDNFKQVNDALGHAEGDTVLREVLNATCEASRLVDTVARFGGDEFAVVLPGTDAQQAAVFAQRLRENVARHLRQEFGAGHPASQVTLSAGLVTLLVGEDLSAPALLARADALLYRAKRSGKDRVVTES